MLDFHYYKFFPKHYWIAYSKPNLQRYLILTRRLNLGYLITNWDSHSPGDKTAKKASCGTSTVPNCFILAFPHF